MNHITLFLVQFILGYVAQSFIFVLGVYAANKQKITAKKYLISVLCYLAVSYTVRNVFPVHYVVHTIIIILIFILICVKYLKLAIYPTITGSFIMVVMLYLFEGVSLRIIQYVVSDTMFNSIVNNPYLIALTALPSTLIFATVILAFYFIFTRSHKKN